MDLKTFYGVVGGNYGLALERMMTEDRVKKYLRRYGGYVDLEGLEKAVAESDGRKIFEISHNVKGMCLNLELCSVGGSASALCENVRNTPPDENTPKLFEKFKEDHEHAIALIGQLD